MIEIERKFLVQGDGWRKGIHGELYRQGYLSSDPRCGIRVRIVGDRAWLTIKGAAEGIARPEFEYPIPLEDAAEILALCGQALVEKVRYKIPFAGLVWEVDEFCGANAGLIMAEVELESEAQEFERPSWAGREVSHDHRYDNANLALHPYAGWPER